MGCLGVPRAKTYVGHCAKTDRKETTRKPNKEKQGRRANRQKPTKRKGGTRGRSAERNSKETTKKQSKKNKKKEHNKDKEQTAKRTTRQTKRTKRRKEEKGKPKHSDRPGSFFFLEDSQSTQHYIGQRVLKANSGLRHWGNEADCFIIHTMCCWCLFIISLPSRSGVNEGKQVTDT